jgi:hypothetical protein
VVVQMSPRRAGQRRQLASPVMPEKMEEGSFSQPNINVWGSRLVAAPSSPTLERAVASPRTRGRQRSSHRAPLPFTPRLGASDLPAVHHYSPTRVPLAPPSLLTTIGGDSLRTAHNDNYAVAPSSTRWSSLSLWIRSRSRWRAPNKASSPPPAPSDAAGTAMAPSPPSPASGWLSRAVSQTTPTCGGHEEASEVKFFPM